MNCAEVFKKRSKLKVWFDSRFCPLNVSFVSLAAVFVSSHETKTASRETKCEFNLVIAEVFFQTLTGFRSPQSLAIKEIRPHVRHLKDCCFM